MEVIHIFAYSIRRILYAIPTFFVVFSIVFLVMRAVPGDPAMAVLGDHATAEALEAMRARMGIDRPMGSQYISFIKGIVRGDLGNSITTNRPILPQIRRVLPFTIELTVAGILWGLLLGIPVGILSALKRNTLIDFLARIVSLLGLSTPSFYLGILLLLFFAVQLDWFPIIGSSMDATIGSRLYYLILPSLSLGLQLAAFVSRSARSSMIDILKEDYIRTAWAKGLNSWTILFVHVLRNALISIVTVTGIYFGVLLGGSILTETVFTRPGLGKFLVEAIQSRDYTAIEGGLIIYSIIIVVVNLIVDLTYGLIDPRISYN